MYYLNHIKVSDESSVGITISKPTGFSTLGDARTALKDVVSCKTGISLPPPFGDGNPGVILDDGLVWEIDNCARPYGTLILNRRSPNQKEIWYISSDEDKNDDWQITSCIQRPVIVDAIFNNPATIVFWSDGTKTVVKCQDGDVYSKETGLAMAMLKRYMGNDNTYNKEINFWLNACE